MRLDTGQLADRRMLRSADLRYHGQSFELPVTVPPGPLSTADVLRLRDEFHAMHERAYGYAAPEDAVELVNVRLAAVGVTPKPRRAPLPEGGPSAASARARKSRLSIIPERRSHSATLDSMISRYSSACRVRVNAT